MYTQVRKDTARKLFNLGTVIYALPCNMCLGNAWMMPFRMSSEHDEDFDKIVNAIEYYNCNSETGSYLRFYTK